MFTGATKAFQGENAIYFRYQYEFPICVIVECLGTKTTRTFLLVPGID